MSLDLHTIGMAMETSGLEKGTRALKDTEQAANKAAEAADKLAAAAKRSAANAEDMAQSVARAKTATEKAAQQTSDFIAKLERQNATFGMTGSQLARYEASLLGVTRAQRTHIDTLLKTADANEKASGGLMTVAKGFLGAAAAALSFSRALSAAEEWTAMNNRIKLVTKSSSEFTQAQNNILRLANETRQPLAETARLYQRLAMNQSQLGLTGAEMTEVVKTISQTMVISGTDAVGASAALVQLGQAFASGVLRGEELNSVMEQAPALSQAIAAGMGKTVGELRAMGAAGTLTAEAVVSALQKQAGAVDVNFKKMSGTVGQAMTTVNTNITEFIGKLDQAAGASKAFAAVIVALGDNIGAAVTAVATLVGFGLVTWLSSATAGIGGVTAALMAARVAAMGLIASIGPIGWIVLGIGALATAWQAVGNRAKTAGIQTDDAASTARAAGEKLTAGLGKALSAISKGYDELIAKQNKALGIAPSAAQEMANSLKNADAQIIALGMRMRQSVEGTGDFAAMDSKARRAATVNMMAEMQVFADQRIATEKQVVESNAKSVDQYVRDTARMTDAQRKDMKQKNAGLEYAEAFRRANGDIGKEVDVRKAYMREIANINEEHAKKSSGQKEAAAAASEYDKLITSINEKIAATQLEIDSDTKLTASEKMVAQVRLDAEKGLIKGIGTNKIYLDGRLALLIANEKELASKEAMAKASADLLTTGQKEVQRITDEIEKQKEHNETIGKTAAQLEELVAAREESRAAAIDDTAAAVENAAAYAGELHDAYVSYAADLREQAEALRELSGLKRQASTRQVVSGEAKKSAEEWKRFTDDIERGLTDSLTRGFEGGKDAGKNFVGSVKNLLKTAAFKMVIQATVTPMLNSVGNAIGATGSGGSSGGGLLDMASNISSAYDKASSLFGWGAASAGTGLAATGATGAVLGTGGTAVGAVGMGEALGTGLVLPKAAAAVTGAAGMGEAIGTGLIAEGATGAAMGTGAASGIMTALPYIGWAIAAIAFISQFVGKGGGPKTEGDYFASIGAGGTADKQQQFHGSDWYTKHDSDANMGTLVTPIATAIYETVKDLGGSSAGISLGLGYNTDPEGTAPDNVTAGVMDASGGYLYGRTYDVERGAAEGALQLESKKILLAGIDASTGLDEIYHAIIKGVNLVTASAAQVDQALADLNNMKAAVNQFRMIFGETAKITQVLVDAAGGVQALGTAMQSYYANFYTQEDQRTQGMKAVGDQIVALGLAAPTTRDGFKALVDGLDVTTASGQWLFGSLMKLAPAFTAVTDAVTDAAAAAANIAGQRRKLEIELVSANGFSGQALSMQRDDALKALDPALRDLQQAVWDAQDAAKATAAANQAAEQAAQAAQQAQDTLRQGWQSVAASITQTIQTLRGGILGPQNSFAVAQSQFSVAAAQAKAGDLTAAQTLPGLATTLVDIGKNMSATATDQALLTARTIATLSGVVQMSTRFGASGHSFAVGTNYVPTDMTAQIHKGERIIPAADNAALMSAVAGSTDAASEIRAMRAEQAAESANFRAEMRALVSNTGKTARILERVTPDGNSLSTKVAP